MILDSLQKCKPLNHATRKRSLFDLQKEYCAPGTQTRIADFENRFCREIEKSIFFCRQSLPKHFVFGQYTSPMRIIVLLSYTQSGVNALHIVNALKSVTLVGQKKLTLLEMFDFPVTQDDNFCKDELITVLFKPIDGKYTSLVLFKPKR